jgi:hypothetical protein
VKDTTVNGIDGLNVNLAAPFKFQDYIVGFKYALGGKHAESPLCCFQCCAASNVVLHLWSMLCCFNAVLSSCCAAFNAVLSLQCCAASMFNAVLFNAFNAVFNAVLFSFFTAVLHPCQCCALSSMLASASLSQALRAA